jgi:hypothetical protein
MPEPQKDKNYNYVLAASAAFYATVREMTFSKDTISRFEKESYAPFKDMLDETTYNNSIEFGKSVSAGIMERAKADHYKETRAWKNILAATRRKMGPLPRITSME